MTNTLTRHQAPSAARPARGWIVLASLLATTTLLPVTASAQGLRSAAQLGESKASAPAASTAQRPADFIVVIVNSEPITSNEVRARLVRTEQQMTQQGTALPAREVLARQVIEQLIQEKAQLQQARESGLKVESSAIDQAELSVAAQNKISVAELRKRLERDGMVYSQFRDNLRDQLLLTRVREREMESRVQVSDFDVDQFLSEQHGNSQGPQDLNLAQILVAVPEQANDAQIAALQARAERVLQRARKGENFTALVQEFSDAPANGQTGGELGLRSADRYPPLFVEATKPLRVGDLAGPLRSGAGFHILKVVEKRDAGLTVTQTHTRHILLRPSAQLSETAAVAKLTELRQRIVSGQADFAALAREYSQDGSAAEGGDLGWVGPGQFVPEFEEVMNGLAPQAISPPVVSRFGVHLIQLLERRQTALTPREQRELARNLVREKKQEEAYNTWVQDVRARAYVEFRETPQ